jgi:hypothetical protein
MCIINLYLGQRRDSQQFGLNAREVPSPAAAAAAAAAGARHGRIVLEL